MARGAEQQAKDTYGRGVAVYNDSHDKSNALFKKLTDYYGAEVEAPKGFAANDLAAMDTAEQQSLGGSTAGITGEANQQAATNRNAGSFAPALAEAERSAGKIHSDAALKTQQLDAMMREGHRQEGIAGQGGLYSGQNADMMSSIGLQNQSTDTLVKAGQSGWFQNMLGLMNAGANVAKAVSGFPQVGGAPAPSCWIAIELYGENNYKTKLLRYFIFNEWNTISGKLFASAYRRFGESAASRIKHSKVLRSFAKLIFDRLYLKAEREIEKRAPNAITIR